MRARLPHVLYGVFTVLCLTALVWPVYPWISSRVEARPFGLPFPFAWNILWVVLSFFALFLYDRSNRRGERW